jgi:DNA-binding transcriptional regulator/RsmH inhibitor MraZ
VDQVILIGCVDTFELWEPKHLAQASRVAGLDQVKLREAAQGAGF